MKINQLCVLCCLVLVAAFSSCEPKNRFDTGPIYDEAGNLAKDSLKIVAYLDTAQVDSLYRIYDASGVVIIVQEEGEGSRPIVGDVAYIDYVGSLMVDGTVFDTSIEQVARENNLYNEDAKYGTYGFVVGGSSNLPVGVSLGIRRLRSGSKARLIIPSPYGYQDSEKKAGIPPNSVIMYDISFRRLD